MSKNFVDPADQIRPRDLLDAADQMRAKIDKGRLQEMSTSTNPAVNINSQTINSNVSLANTSRSNNNESRATLSSTTNFGNSIEIDMNAILAKPTTNKTRATFLLDDVTLEALRLLEIEAKKVAKAMGKQPGRTSRSWLIEAAVFMAIHDFKERGVQSNLAKRMELLPSTGQERA